MYSELYALKRRAEAGRRVAGKVFSQREIEKALSKPPYSIAFRGQAISDWLPEDAANAKVPRDADVVWAVARLWCHWAGERTPNENYWRNLVERAQPVRSPQRHAQLWDAPTEGLGIPHMALRAALPQPVLWPRLVGVIPRKAQSFQDRQETQQVRVAAESGGRAILRGTGGVGKSQLAAHYARTALQAGKLDVLVWVSASSRTAVISAYAQAAEEVLGADSSDPEQAARRFLGSLEPRPATQETACRWLIVLDDLAEPGEITGLWPPESPMGQTLVTTRRRDVSLGGQRLIEVGAFSLEQAAAYITAFLSEHDRQDDPSEHINALAADLGCLPLALSQASAYLVDADIPIDCPPQCTHVRCDSYRRQLADRAMKLEDVLPDPGALRDDQTTTVAAAWSLSVDRADMLCPVGLARPMLQLASMLDPNGIPAPVFTSPAVINYLAEHRAEGLRVGHITSQEALAALRVLHRLSLLDHTRRSPERAVRVHQLVQRAIRDTLTPHAQNRTARAAADALMASWPADGFDTPLVQSLRANAAALSHLAEGGLYDGGAHWVLFRTGTSLGESGQVAAAVRHFQRLHRSAQKRLGPEHRAALAAHAHLAHWSGEAGDTTSAVAIYEQVLTVRENILGRSHPETLTVRSLLARWIGEAGHPAAAVTTYRQVLADRERVLGPDHPDTLDTRGFLARWLEEAEGPVAAFTVTEQLLADSLRALGPDHPDILSRRHNLARLLGVVGDAAAAVTAHKQLLADKERVLGTDHPSTLTSRTNLAYWTEAAGDPAAAASVFRQVLAEQERLLGADHPDTLRTQNGLAQCLGRAGAPAHAVTAFQQLLTDYLRVFGPDHPDVFVVRQNLAYWLGESGDIEATLTAHEGLLADRERVLGRDHPETLRTRASYIHHVGEAGDPSAALAAYQLLLADALRVFGPEAPDTLRIKVNLARWVGDAGDPAAAVTAYEEVLADRERVLGPDHSDTLSTRGYLARWRQEVARRTTRRASDS
ncbi:tetratricopeptide repeat protein [Streptomyces spororaveus]|uniref:tetratricopeptide repeat protein n=1 Tax=Streptomyces spororaveus TaxID=284039 RepID=UPI0037B3C216